MLAKIGTTDITDYINESTYKMDKAGNYTSWQDGNLVEHRVYSRSKISGSFTLGLYGKNGMDIAAFQELLASSTDNNVTNMIVYVSNTGKLEEINAFVTITTSKHTALDNGTVVDVLTVKIEER